MKRQKLQHWIFWIWLGGLGVLEFTVFWSSYEFKLDSFEVGPRVAQEFENTYKASDARLADDGKRVLDNLSHGKINARDEAGFKAELLHLFPKDDLPRPYVVNWLVSECAQKQVQKLWSVYLQIYAPWLVVMLTAMFADARHDSGPIRSKKAISARGSQRKAGVMTVSSGTARIAIGTSLSLQLFFLMFLIMTLNEGDLSGTRDIQPIATIVAAIVGCLVQFVFHTSQVQPNADGATEEEQSKNA